MKRYMLTAVLVLAGCVDDSDTNSPFGSASSAESASDSQTALPKITDQQIEGSSAMDLMAAVRRLDDIASHFASMREFSAGQVEEIDRDRERLKEITPPEGVAAVYKQYAEVSDEMRRWADAGQTVDGLPTKNGSMHCERLCESTSRYFADAAKDGCQVAVSGITSKANRGR